MSDFDPSVLDLALYFATDDGDVGACWVPHDVYTKRSCLFDKNWKMGDLLEVELAAGAVHYVLNLSRLIPPGVGPLPPSFPAPNAVPGPHDLVIVPPDDPGTAYLVSRAVYTDPNQCPPLDRSHEKTADLDNLALTYGVVLANLPKVATPSGWTCFLLSLLSLRSGAMPGVATNDKNDYFSILLEKNED